MIEIINSSVAIVVAIISLIGLIVTVRESKAKDRQRLKDISRLENELISVRSELNNFVNTKLRDIIRALREDSPYSHHSRDYYEEIRHFHSQVENLNLTQLELKKDLYRVENKIQENLEELLKIIQAKGSKYENDTEQSA